MKKIKITEIESIRNLRRHLAMQIEGVSRCGPSTVLFHQRRFQIDGSFDDVRFVTMLNQSIECEKSNQLKIERTLHVYECKKVPIFLIEFEISTSIGFSGRFGLFDGRNGRRRRSRHRRRHSRHHSRQNCCGFGDGGYRQSDRLGLGFRFGQRFGRQSRLSGLDRCRRFGQRLGR